MRLALPSRDCNNSLNNDRFLGRIYCLIPDSQPFDDEASDDDWEAQEPGDEDLDADNDADWWLDNEDELEASPDEDDWPEYDEDEDF